MSAPKDIGGIGGKAVSNSMVCSNRSKIPISVSFPKGQNEVVISSDQLCATAGVSSPAALQLDGIEFTGCKNESSHVVGISVNGKHNGEAYNLPTLSRTTHFSPLRDGTSTGVATLAVYGKGETKMSQMHGFVAIDDPKTAKYTDHKELTDAERESAIKKSTVWKQEHAMSGPELRAGCIAAEKGGVKRWAIPITGSAHTSRGVSKLVALNHGTPDGSRKLAQMFPTSNTKSTVMMMNPDHESTTEIPHLIVSDRDMQAATDQMASNLSIVPGSGALVLRAHHANHPAVSPDGDVHATLTLHRTPLAGASNQIPYMHIGSAADILKHNTDLAGFSTASAPSEAVSAAKIFGHDAPDSAPATDGVATIVSPPEAIAVDVDDRK